MKNIDLLKELLEKVEKRTSKWYDYPYQVMYIRDTANICLSNTTHVSMFLNRNNDAKVRSLLIGIYHKENGLLKSEEIPLKDIGIDLSPPIISNNVMAANQEVMKNLINSLYVLWGK